MESPCAPRAADCAALAAAACAAGDRDRGERHGSRLGHLSRRAVPALRLHAVGFRLVRGPLDARLLGAFPGGWGRARHRGDRGPLRCRLGLGLRLPRRAALRARGASRIAGFCRRHRGAGGDRAGARSCSGRRSAWRRWWLCSAAGAGGERWQRRSRSPARSRVRYRASSSRSRHSPGWSGSSRRGAGRWRRPPSRQPLRSRCSSCSSRARAGCRSRCSTSSARSCRSLPSRCCSIGASASCGSASRSTAPLTIASYLIPTALGVNVTRLATSAGLGFVICLPARSLPCARAARGGARRALARPMDAGPRPAARLAQPGNDRSLFPPAARVSRAARPPAGPRRGGAAVDALGVRLRRAAPAAGARLGAPARHG
jgi:hypothetical protein